MRQLIETVVKVGRNRHNLPGVITRCNVSFPLHVSLLLPSMYHLTNLEKAHKALTHYSAISANPIHHH